MACNKKESDIKKMADIAKRSLEDYAFKENSKIDFIEFKTIKCDTIDENVLLSSNRGRLLDQVEYFTKMRRLEMDNLKLSNQQIKLYAMLGSQTLMDIEKDKAKELLKKSQDLSDSIKFYLNKDSLIEKKIKANKKPRAVYQLKTFIKAINNSKKGKENVLDTFYFRFDDKLNQIKD